MKALISIALAAGLLAPAAGAADLKIGYVQIERIYREAAPAVAIQKKLEKEFGERRTELKRLSDRAKDLENQLSRSSLSDRDRKQAEREYAGLDRDYRAKAREFSEDFNQRRNEEFSGVQERANRAVKQIAEREQFDIVLQDAVYVSPRIDLTAKVLKELEK
ncbi:OmpH family outer membrane protein [Crenobacter cavernae]|uniref:OmpH family outer membrane protein n=1 Tax=Crenobacter cavernae TaxID=2290923 RepID=A0A345Y835_9NEIS|nr:OmpH family outer membrane protein [Crenobacter cavernae]AXK40087.1 OmpH family outer membrane protein [Crenobacter cavernae]